MIAGTLGRYFARRFFKTIAAVFAGVFALIYAIDVVEMLRRSGDTPGAVGAADGLAVAVAHPDRRRTGAAVRRAVRRDDLVPQPVAEARAGGGAVRRRVGMAVPRAARLRRGGDRHRRRFAVQSGVDGDEAPGRPNRGQAVRRRGKLDGRDSGSAKRASTANRSCTPTAAAMPPRPLSTSRSSVSDPTAPSSSASTPKPRRSKTATGV